MNISPSNWTVQCYPTLERTSSVVYQLLPGQTQQHMFLSSDPASKDAAVVGAWLYTSPMAVEQQRSEAVTVTLPSCLNASVPSFHHHQGALHGADSPRESLLGYQKVFFFQSGAILWWFCEVILWNKLRGWEQKKVASPDSVKWFSIVILRVYAKKSKRIIFSLIITSPEN